MVLTVYDSFLRAESWPGDEERVRLAGIYGWPDPAPIGAGGSVHELPGG